VSEEPYEPGDGVWVLPFSGTTIEHVSWEGDSYIVLHLSPGSEADVTIGMSLTQRIGRDLAGTTIREATFTPSGVLTVTLDDGTVLETHCDPVVENWEIRGPDGLWITAVAGDDDVAIWS
jgi:hypothetical protein